MHQATMRRQNHSCDQCRRSKRRCIRVVGDENQVRPQCESCARLQYECTFDFVNLQLVKKQKQANLNSPRNHRWKEPATTETFRAQSNYSHRVDHIDNDPSNHVDGDIPVESVNNTDEIWIECGTDCASNIVQLSPSTSTARANSITPCVRQAAAASSTPGFVQQQQVPPSANASLNLYSPVQPLNTSVATVTFNRILKHLYHKVQDGASSRFLSHGCDSVSVITLQGLRDSHSSKDQDVNLSSHANATKNDQATHAELNSHERSPSLVDSASVEDLFHPSHIALNAQKQEVAMVSLVRFLDRLGAIYQAGPEKGSAQESLRLLNTVIRAFSMQWLVSPRSWDKSSERQPFNHKSGPSSTTETTAYTSAWLFARRCLQEAKSRQTFSFIYAAFLFHMTVKPDQLPNELAQTCDSHEFLDEALDHLMVLHKAARQLCVTLGDGSNYAKIILSGLGVMERFGYIRDTVSAFMDERNCRVESWNDLDHSLESLEASISLAIDAGQSNMFAIDVPDVCQSLSFRIFQTWKEILRFERFHKQKRGTNTKDKAKLLNYVRVAVTAVDNFNTKFRLFLDTCQDNFERLEHKAQVASALAIMYSDFGLIILAEQIDDYNRSEYSSQCPQLQEKSDRYRAQSTSSTTRLLRSVMNLSVLEIEGKTTTRKDKTPLIFEHINLKLIMCAIYKCIENSVHMYRTAVTYSQFLTELGDQDLNQSLRFGRDIKTSFQCLLSLNQTIVGSFTARTTLESLLRQYGETILECWLLTDE